MPASNRRARRQVLQSVRDGPQRPRPAAAGPPSRWLSAHRLQRLPCGRPAGRRPHSLRQNESEEPAPRIRSQATIGWRKCRNCRKGRSSRRLKSPALEPVHHGRRTEPRQLRHPATAPRRLRRDTGASSSLIHRCRAGTRSAIVPQSNQTVEDIVARGQTRSIGTISEASRRSCLSLGVRLAYWAGLSLRTLGGRRATGCRIERNSLRLIRCASASPQAKAKQGILWPRRTAPEFSASLSIVQVQTQNACSVPCCTAARAQVFPPGAEWSVGCALLSS